MYLFASPVGSPPSAAAMERMAGLQRETTALQKNTAASVYLGKVHIYTFFLTTDKTKTELFRKMSSILFNSLSPLWNMVMKGMIFDFFLSLIDEFILNYAYIF